VYDHDGNDGFHQVITIIVVIKKIIIISIKSIFLH